MLKNIQIKHYNNLSNIFKINNKDIRTRPDASIVNFEHIPCLINIDEFSQLYKSWLGQKNRSFRQ